MRAATYLFVTLLWATSAVAQTLPKPSGRVTDLANVIDAGTEADIVARLDQLERQTSSEVAVVTVPSLDDVPVDDYAVRLFKEWGIGQAKQDNGVLVLVAPNEREMRIEVGYGLEGILPDGLAGQIIREQFIPRFRDNDYNGGIRDGVARVVEIVEKQQVLTAEELAKFNETARTIFRCGSSCRSWGCSWRLDSRWSVSACERKPGSRSCLAASLAACR